MLIAENKIIKYLFLFLTGGFAYGAVENLSRGYSHISMLIAGGICFILIGQLNNAAKRKKPIISRMAVSALIITTVEFIVGIIVNVWLKLNVWDYSYRPFNIMGQVCLLYSLIWFFLSYIAIHLNELIRVFILKENRTNYPEKRINYHPEERTDYPEEQNDYSEERAHYPEERAGYSLLKREL